MDTSTIIQLDDWIKGKPHHNEDKHLPDFSCCYPELLADRHVREDCVKALINDERDIVIFYMYHFFDNYLGCLVEHKILEVKPNFIVKYKDKLIESQLIIAQ